MITILFELLSKYCLEIVYEISDDLIQYSGDIDDFSSELYKGSPIKEDLKEEFVRQRLATKLESRLLHNTMEAGSHIINWKKIKVEKEYPNTPSKKCDIFLQGNTADSKLYSGRYVYNQEDKRDVWIEIKFLTPVYSTGTVNRAKIINDLLRLYYNLKDYRTNIWFTERYFILFLLCGQYGSNKMGISNFLGGDNRLLEVFFPPDLNVEMSGPLNLKECVKENINFSSFKEALDDNIKSIIEEGMDIERIYLDRKYITPIPFFKDITYENSNKALFCYILNIRGYQEPHRALINN